MAHHINRTGYSKLVDRLNKFPQGAPPSPLLNKILLILFSEKEADLVSQLPIRPFTAERASKIWNLDKTDTKKVLDELASRALLVDIHYKGETSYSLPPPMAGFFEFSMMRIRNDIDQSALSELFHQYITQEDDFIQALFTDGETHLGRTFVNELALLEQDSLVVLDYERATEVIKQAS
ncbi:MAG: (Fe-S)-binding protein, partial [Candidatus Neomarinimicrobiota bacterium]